MCVKLPDLDDSIKLGNLVTKIKKNVFCYFCEEKKELIYDL